MFTALYIDFLDAQGQVTVVSGRIWLKFELIQAYMHVLVSCKNEEDPIKNEGARVFTTFLILLVYGEFFRRSRAANSAVHGPIMLNLYSFQTLWLSSLPAKMKKIQSNMKELECSQHYTWIFQTPKGCLVLKL